MLVDAGYVLAAAANVVSGDPGRPGIEVDYPGLVAALTERAAAETGLPVLRVYWYDAAPATGPTREQRQLRVLDGLKLRLGKLVRRDDGKFEQKGVDTFLHADLTGLARKRAVADVVLVSGDEDLLHAVEEAQEYGTRIHLWGAASDYNQSLELIAAVDKSMTLSEEWLKPYVWVKNAPVYGDEPGYGPPKPDVGVGEHAKPAHKAFPSPLDMPQRLLHPTESPKTPLANSRFPKLWQVTSPTQRFLDAEENKSMGRAEPIDVGRAYVARWMARATEAERRRLTDWTATWTWVPHDLDPDLLRFANDLGIDTWEAELEPIKHELRAGFLDGLKKWEQRGAEMAGAMAGAMAAAMAASEVAAEPAASAQAPVPPNGPAVSNTPATPAAPAAPVPNVPTPATTPNTPVTPVTPESSTAAAEPEAPASAPAVPTPTVPAPQSPPNEAGHPGSQPAPSPGAAGSSH
ncbi:NYN domain-containing protein [Catenulispora sp. NF23]|uniref:NYN domain-containing protein n=1 Tax=Catenulispora pinistramenti TaxID=2705254 RepID=UPI001BAD0B26|nr:NYN domain-containing protein [Catenulispora pinistramenti]MBS2537765.1 NYN domain-containing protein [Catenulispora pinistramenti]